MGDQCLTCNAPVVGREFCDDACKDNYTPKYEEPPVFSDPDEWDEWHWEREG